MNLKPIINAAVVMQSASLVGENLCLLKKKKKKSSDFVKTGVKTIVGASLIKSESDIIGGL